MILVRNHRNIARLVPEPRSQTALEVLGDLYRTLDDETADALVAAINSGKKAGRGKLNELLRRPEAVLSDMTVATRGRSSNPGRS